MSDDNAHIPSQPVSLPAPVRAAAGRVRATWDAFSRPVRMVLAITVLVGAALAGWISYRAANVPYGVLYAQLDRDDASALVAKLRELKVPYRIEAEGATVLVPQTRVHELRLDLASAGLPRGGGVGFESFDRMRLGATEFEQHVLYRRALEGELARTISALGAVQTARVHLVLPERSVFVSRSEPASASVVLHLRPGQTLDGARIAGVVHMVASSVQGLNAAHVSLVTSDGTMLHRPTNGDEADGVSEEDPATRTRGEERSMEERVRTMLERLVGPDHVDVRVTMEMDYSRLERVEDTYDHEHPALRREEALTERTSESTTTGTPVAGVPGAESNLPDGAARAAGAAGDTSNGTAAPTDVATAAGVVRSQHTRNFEVDHVTERQVSRNGRLRRMTVAVVVDGVSNTVNGRRVLEPRSAAEVTRIEGLVKSAVGAREARGDVVTVESLPFLATEVAQAAEVAAHARRPAVPAAWKRWLPVAGVGAALLLVAIVALVMRRRATSTIDDPLSAEQIVALNAVSDPEVAVAALSGAEPPRAALPEAAPENEQNDRLLRLRTAAVERAQADPATAALVMRFWLGNLPDEEKVPVPAIGAKA